MSHQIGDWHQSHRSPSGILNERSQASAMGGAAISAGPAAEAEARRPPELTVPVAETRNGQKSVIWAIGGGKGGTGKTFVSATLGQQLSRHGSPVNLVDADLGAPNLHTFLGVPEPATDLSDFFFGKQLPLQSVLVDGGGAGLRFAAGSNRHFNLSNLEHFRRLKFLRHIKSLPGQVIIDIGAGAALNAIDFFKLSDVPILVANANPASIENLFLFLEAVALRIIEHEIQLHSLQEAMRECWHAAGKPPKSVPSLLEMVRQVDLAVERKIRQALNDFQPCLIVNKARGDNDVLLGRCLEDVAKRCLGTRMHYVGAIPFDHRVADCLNQFCPFVPAHPTSETAVSIMLIMDKLLERSRSLEGSR